MSRSTPGPAPLADASPSRRPLIAVCLAALSLPLAFTGAAVATPAVGAAFDARPAELAWITNAFMLTFGSTLLAAGSLADHLGRRRLLLSGLLVFAAASLGGVMAPGVLVLDLLRALQGLGAAAALAGGTAALAQVYEGPGRLKAFSFLGTTFGLGLALGPVLAGFAVETWGWRVALVGPAGPALLAWGLARGGLGESRNPGAGSFDWRGALAFTGFLALLTFALVQGPESGWDHPLVLAALGATPMGLGLFIRLERRGSAPLLDLSLFRDRRFLAVQVLPIATCYAFVVLLILLPWRFIGVEGRSPGEAGLLMMVLSAPMAILPPLAAHGTGYLSTARLCSLGLVIAALGLLGLAWVSPGDGTLPLVVVLGTIGAGTALPWGLMDGLSVSVVPKERAGMAAGLFGTVRVAGEGVALASVTAVLALLVQWSLVERGGKAGEAAAAGLNLAVGNTGTAVAMMAGDVTREAVIAAYFPAFSVLTVGLAGITLVAALVVLIGLDRPKMKEDP